MLRKLFMLAALLLLTHTALAQLDSYSVNPGGGVVEFTGQFESAEATAQITFQRMEIGDIIYVFVQGGGDADPLAMIYNISDFYTPLMGDDNSGGGTNAMFQYEVTVRGDYIVYIWTLNGAGDYRIVAGVNTPEVLNEAISDTTFENTLSSAAGFSCENVPLGERPQLSGTPFKLEGANFVLHYTFDGSDATTQELVITLYQAVEASLLKMRELGWAPPIPDCGEEGDTRLDVYLQSLEYGLFGYAQQDNLVGDNPGTPGREVNASYGHLVIDNDMDYDPENAIIQLQATTAHELHHIVQFGYDGRDFYYGFYEGGAMWMQNQVFPGDPLLYDTVQAVFDFPDVCIGSQPYRDGFSRIYGEWLMIDSITRDHGPTSYEDIWEKLILEQGLTGFYNALSEMGTTPQEVIRRMAIRNLLHDYPQADDTWGTVSIAATVRRAGKYSPRFSGIQELGVDYVRIEEQGVYQLDLNGKDLIMYLVGLDTNTGSVTVFNLGKTGAVDTMPFTDVYVIIQNTRQHIFPEDCLYTDWTLTVTDGTGGLTTAPLPETWSMAQYVPAK